MKTLLLAAGRRAVDTDSGGTAWPKNLIEIAGMPLLSHVIQKLGPLATDGKLIVVVRHDEVMLHHTDQVVKLSEPTASVVAVGDTAGAACSALLACESVEPDEPLLVCNGDQVIDTDLGVIVADFEARDIDAGVVVFEAVHPRWSFVRIEDSRVVEASEKRPISRNATAGAYWFRRGGDFLSAVMDMIRKEASVSGSFFVCPSLNELVLRGAVIGTAPIERSEYFSLHEPADVSAYEQHLSRRLAETAV